MKKKKEKKIPVIKRRLLKIACQKCRERANHTCEICGMKAGEIYNGKPQKVEAHHIMSKSNKSSPLKYDLRNLICLCTNHHKFGLRSAHKHGLWFAKELIRIRPQDADWIIEHTDDSVDLEDRVILADIENRLKNDLPLNLNKIQKI